MLKLISLWTLHKIFERAKNPVSGMCQMIYINCLMHHFEKLEATEENSLAFEIFDSELDYEKFEKYFVELHKAGLVIIKEKSIYFENHWGQFIERSLLSRNVSGYATDIQQNSIVGYSEQLKTSKELEAHICKNHKLTSAQYNSNLQEFIEEQIATGKTYNNYRDVSSHFFYWLNKRKNNAPEKGKSSKILGYE